ncbi:MAG: PorP/SprF family type IX secretion system membrane protein [Cytophagaceae bacterium]|nr:PorP/SprF family type IX secretion system membrane protein [Cytophagaceae bacterium]
MGDIFKVILSKGFSVFILIAVLIFSDRSYGQDAQFSQYYASELYLNPAFAGSDPNVSVSTNYRQQWNSIIGTPYITGQVSAIIPFNSKKGTIRHLGGMGFSVYQNRAGEGHFQTLGANASFGYNLEIANLHHVIFGLQAGMVQKSIRLQDLKWGSQFNPLVGGYDPSVTVSINNLNNNVFYPDFAAGLMYEFNPHRGYSEKGTSVFIGGSAYHLTQPNESMLKDSVSRLPMLFKLFGGTELNIGQRVNLSPNAFLAYQNLQYQINVGGYLTFIFTKNQHQRAMPAYLSIGSWYRVRDAMIFSLAIGNETYRLGFSYDLNNSSLRYNTQGKGAYEISLRIQKPSREVRTQDTLI